MPKKRKPSQLARDKRNIAEMYLKGSTQQVIADELSISQATVSVTLAELREEWLESSLIDLDQRKAMELEKIDQLEAEYWIAWKRSLRMRGTTTEEGLIKGGALHANKLSKVKVVSSESDGNPAFLAGIDRCVERRCRILGLEAPKKTAEFNANKEMSWLEFIGKKEKSD